MTLIRFNLPCFTGLVTLALAVGLMGACQKVSQKGGSADPLAVSKGADLQRDTEVQLVEQMARHRRLYQEHLDALKMFYDRQGNHIKASWVRVELEQLELGPQREYLVIAEVAGPDLQSQAIVEEADTLYREAMNYVKEGRGALGRLFAKKKKLYTAIEKLDELITNYPTSDKIDDAAFQIAEIYRYYLKEYNRALLYYQRVWQWDARTPLPARYWVARIYDDQLHNRVKALYYYEQVVNLESSYPKNVVYAENRITDINQELSAE